MSVTISSQSSSSSAASFIGRDCVGSFVNAPAVLHGCYQDSPLRSVPMAASLRLHRSTFRSIDAFLAVTDHVADQLRSVGMPDDRIVVRPNFVPDPLDGDDGTATTPDGHGFLFAGRLSAEKGVELLLDAWDRSGRWAHEPLFVAGSGDLDHLVRDRPADQQVVPLGLVDHAQLMDHVRASAVTVVPSTWPEPFGRGVIEAAALGRPSLVTDAGGLPSLVVDGSTGWVAEPTVDGLAEGIRRASDPVARRGAGHAARRRYEERYTRDVSLGILDDTLSTLARRGSPRG